MRGRPGAPSHHPSRRSSSSTSCDLWRRARRGRSPAAAASRSSFVLSASVVSSRTRARLVSVHPRGEPAVSRSTRSSSETDDRDRSHERGASDHCQQNDPHVERGRARQVIAEVICHGRMHQPEHERDDPCEAADGGKRNGPGVRPHNDRRQGDFRRSRCLTHRAHERSLASRLRKGNHLPRRNTHDATRTSRSGWTAISASSSSGSAHSPARRLARMSSSISRPYGRREVVGAFRAGMR